MIDLSIESSRASARRPAAKAAATRRSAATAAHAAKKPAARTRAAKVKPAKPSRPRKPVNHVNRRVLALLWLLPVSIPLMWQRACTWRLGVKVAVTAVAVVLVAALLAFPMPTGNRNVAGGVELVNSTEEVEVYGPDLPAYVVPGYTSEQGESVIVDAVENNVHYVYAADGAKCYHEYECKFAFASSQRLTVYEAYFLGFKPCNRCNPPKYNGVP